MLDVLGVLMGEKKKKDCLAIVFGWIEPIVPEIFKILIKVLEVKHLGWKRISETMTLGEKKKEVMNM